MRGTLKKVDGEYDYEGLVFRCKEGFMKYVEKEEDRVFCNSTFTKKGVFKMWETAQNCMGYIDDWTYPVVKRICRNG